MRTEHFLQNSQFIPSHPRVLLESKRGFSLPMLGIQGLLPRRV